MLFESVKLATNIMIDIFFEYGIHLALCLVGVGAKITYVLKKESDKFEETRANFNEKKFARKNKWDFVFYVFAGVVMLTAKSLIRDYVGVEDVTDYALSCLSGLVGSEVIGRLLSK